MKRYLAGMVVALSVLLGASTLPAAEPEVLEVYTPEIRTLTQHLEPDPAALPAHLASRRPGGKAP